MINFIYLIKKKSLHVLRKTSQEISIIIGKSLKIQPCSSMSIDLYKQVQFDDYLRNITYVLAIARKQLKNTMHNFFHFTFIILVIFYMMLQCDNTWWWTGRNITHLLLNLCRTLFNNSFVHSIVVPTVNKSWSRWLVILVLIYLVNITDF